MTTPHTPALPGPADELELVLRSPITLGPSDGTGVTYAVLNLTEPTGEQLAAAEAQAGAMGPLLTLIHKNAGVPMAVAQRMRQRDLQRAADFFAGFRSPSGSVSSESSSQS